MLGILAMLSRAKWQPSSLDVLILFLILGWLTDRGQLRKVVDVPVPKILCWSARSEEPNSVGAAYILMERVKGHQLSHVWETMSEFQRFGLVKSLVEVERRLASIRFSNYGSLYYNGSRPKTLTVIDSADQSVDTRDAVSKFVIGPTTERSFWVDERRGLDIDRGPWTSFEEYISAIYDALLVRSETQVTAGLLRAANKLKVVARAGVGVDNIDVGEATKLGIVVVNSPSGNVEAAAEHTVALMLSMARNIPLACSSLKAGHWERNKLVGVEVKGKTLGVIGLGKVGLTVAKLAKGLGMNVISLDPYAPPAVAASASVTLVSSLSELLPVVDFLTIHTPLISSTRNMISTRELAQLKPGSRILNVARGGTVDEEALLAALESGHLAGAAVDVFTSEPPEANSSAAKLISHPHVVATPHLGASTTEAQESVSIDVCEQVLQILNGSLPRSAVNAPLILPEEYNKLQPFVHLIEKVGSLYTQHFACTDSGPMQRSTFDLIYQGELANVSNTKPLFAALVKGLMSPISSSAGLNINIVNAELIARERCIIVNEQHSRDMSFQPYSSLVTLAARSPPSILSRLRGEATQQYEIISGTCSGCQPVINRLGRFATSFVPEGTLLICGNYDSPGKIGVGGTILGREGININFMAVAPISNKRLDTMDGCITSAVPNDSRENKILEGDRQDSETAKDALMILSVDSHVNEHVAAALVREGGVLYVSVVTL
ncbi:d-3-phosphoglycerate dehydrogenase [Paecilomyces variotii No. 5]|uniref:D-3-phosphoglycerate dehydrogenase n=1 Tax=Byssochlamys spectabilis (strain No. 5 / NBRC 109023) TaxID=1356009 RepID=V5I608_BYSSN|nr:d-3-phosphoglycerate dehydrogenase [Paecilomyces variotii No. 5]